MRRLHWLAALTAACSLSQAAQNPAPAAIDAGQSVAPVPSPALIARTREERERAYRAAHHIVLNVVVTDASGNPVRGLSQDNFTILDNQQPQTIASFQAGQADSAGRPVRATLLLDGVNNSSRNAGSERREVEKFLSQNQGRLASPVAVAVLSSSGITRSQPSQDGNVLIAELKTYARELNPSSCADEVDTADSVASTAGGAAVNPDGEAVLKTENLMSKLGDCENRRFKHSIAQLNHFAKQQAAAPGRVLLIWIGPGWPELSGPEFRPDTPGSRQAFFDYLVDLSTSLREAQVTLSAVGAQQIQRRAEPRAQPVKASFTPTTEDEASARSLALPVLAQLTGGRVMERGAPVSAAIAACIADAESSYVLSFDSAPAAKPGEYHSLDVKVSKAGLTVRTTPAYYAEP